MPKPTVSTRALSSKTLILAVFVAFIAGFVCGVGYSVWRSADSPHGHTAMPHPPGATGAQGGIADLEAAAQADPDNAQLWVRLGDAFSDSGQADNAVAAYTRALAIAPENNNARTDLGVAYFHSNMPEEAIAEFDKVLAADPKHPQARFNRGVVLYSGLGDRQGALAEWRRLLDLHPETRTPDGRPLGELIRELEGAAKADKAEAATKTEEASAKTGKKEEAAAKPPAAGEIAPPEAPSPAEEKKPADPPPSPAADEKPPTETAPPAPDGAATGSAGRREIVITAL